MKPVDLVRGALFGALFAASLQLSAAPISAKSTVTAVTAYTDRAVVTRTAKVQLPALGPVEVVFDNLPATLIDQSLTVSGRGGAQATILDVTARNVPTAVTPNERVKAIEDEIRDLAKQRQALADREAVLKAQGASLDRLEAASTAAPTKDSAPRLTIEESLKFLAFLEEQRTKQITARQALEAQIEELQARQSAAEERLMALQDGNSRSYRTVTVRLAAATAGDLELAISYAVPGASWTPTYDARSNSTDSTVELSYFGTVTQNTGEDWSQVALTLSTAQPSLGGSAPETGVWLVDVQRPRPVPMQTILGSAPGMRREGDSNTASLLPRAPAYPIEPEPAPTTIAQADVETALTSASFKVATAATVPSDNSPQKLPITTIKLAATPEHISTPKRLPTAFLTAKVVNSSDYPLLPGSLNVFLDGTFVATSRLPSVMPGEKFDLALGADEGIAIKHKRVLRFAEDTGLTNRGRRVTYEYLITIQNNKRIPARIVVSDHVPISRYERIVVKVISPTEKELKPAPDGILKWNIDLKPGEKRDLSLKFSIEHPSELSVSGLES